jgi:hypothetical protein
MAIACSGENGRPNLLSLREIVPADDAHTGALAVVDDLDLRNAVRSFQNPVN